jgi:hypothetical protein
VIQNLKIAEFEGTRMYEFATYFDIVNEADIRNMASVSSRATSRSCRRW